MVLVVDRMSKKKSRKEVGLEYSMGFLSGLLHDVRPFALCYREEQRKVMIHFI